MKEMNQSAMQSLFNGLVSPSASSSGAAPASSPTPPSASSSSSRAEGVKRGRPKKNPETEQLTVMIDIDVMDKVRALAWQESWSIKDIFTDSVKRFIESYESRFGELKVAKRKAGSIENIPR